MKTDVIRMRVTEIRKTQIERAAELAGQTVSKWIDLAIEWRLAERMLTYSPEVPSQVARAEHEVTAGTRVPPISVEQVVRNPHKAGTPPTVEFPVVSTPTTYQPVGAPLPPVAPIKTRKPARTTKATKKDAERAKAATLCVHRMPVGSFCLRCAQEKGE